MDQGPVNLHKGSGLRESLKCSHIFWVLVWFVMQHYYGNCDISEIRETLTRYILVIASEFLVWMGGYMMMSFTDMRKTRKNSFWKRKMRSSIKYIWDTYWHECLHVRQLCICVWNFEDRCGLQNKILVWT